MQWVTVTSACRMQFRAWPLVLKAKWGSWRGRRWSCRGKTERAPPSLGLDGFLSVCASSYLLVTRGSALTESSWWRETLSIATGPVCPPPSVNLMQAALTIVWRTAVWGEKQMPNTKSRLRALFREPTHSVFQPQSDGVNGCSEFCKTADFLDTRRGHYNSLHKH